MTRHVTITGRVQGVGFRAWAAEEARRRGLNGWVRNRRDGSVEAVFAGDEIIVGEMIAACRFGPSMARVDRVIESEASDDVLKVADRNGFGTLPTL